MVLDQTRTNATTKVFNKQVNLKSLSDMGFDIGTYGTPV